MKNKSVVVLTVVLGVMAFVAGTAISGEGVEEKQAGQDMAPPPPPAQLKALEAFVGEWRGEYEHLPAMFGESAMGTGRGKTDWVLDGWFVKSEGIGTSSFGTHKSIWLATYDPKTRSYRSFSFDNFGTVDIGTLTHDPKTGTWTALSDGVDIKTGQPNENKFTMHFVNNDKMEWQWFAKGQGETEYTMLMKGTDTRVQRKP